MFVTGRLKDLIIIGGRNLYPHEIELTVEQSHPALRPACCAAFSVEVADEERLIVAAEMEPRYAANRIRLTETGTATGTSMEMEMETAAGTATEMATERAHPHHNGRLPLDLEAVVRAIRRAVAEEHDVRVHAVLLCARAAFPRPPAARCNAAFARPVF